MVRVPRHSTTTTACELLLVPACPPLPGCLPRSPQGAPAMAEAAATGVRGDAASSGPPLAGPLCLVVVELRPSYCLPGRSAYAGLGAWGERWLALGRPGRQALWDDFYILRFQLWRGALAARRGLPVDETFLPKRRRSSIERRD